MISPRRVTTGVCADDPVRRFFDGLVLNWLIYGTDAHSKSYSLLLSGREVRFAPFYDVASALPYDLPTQKMRMAMKFGGTYLVTGPSIKMWERVAAELGLPSEFGRDRAAALMESLLDAFLDAASDPAVQAIGSTCPAFWSTRSQRGCCRRAKAWRSGEWTRSGRRFCANSRKVK